MNSDDTITKPELWKSLYYFNLYRLVLSGGLITSAIAGNPPGMLGSYSSKLFLIGSIAMVVISVMNTITITNGKPDFRFQAHFQFGADVVIITLLLHASNGVASGLGLLLIVSVAGAAVVFTGRKTLFYAAMASLFPLGEHLYSLFLTQGSRASSMQVGFLGVGLFATGYILYIIASRFQITEQLAESRARDIATLEQLNQLVVDRLHIGVAVISRNAEFRLLNSMAQSILNDQQLAQLKQMIREKNDTLVPLQSGSSYQTGMRINFPGRLEVNVYPYKLADSEESDIILFFEDVTEYSKQIQQVKLAALGRLTAAIAHEVRNPLGAMSHAAQLLYENQNIDKHDRRLIDIIQQHGQRINRIIETILQLGRRDTESRETLNLNEWIREFLGQFSDAYEADIDCNLQTSDTVQVQFNPNHLGQVLSNLCENAVKHSSIMNGNPNILIQTRLADEGARLEVIDQGLGIPEEFHNQLFEPFFTTSTEGTGLGLFIARELCEANAAHLDFYPNQPRGSCFCIRFAIQQNH